jgi:dinuclear metal center YbgI/SA1388 family protein
MLLNELRDYIGSLLEVGRFRDYCPNGVQIEGRPEVWRIATGVTASQRLLDAALAWGADAVLVHHGYFWRGEEAALVGIKKQRIARLLREDVSLMAYHLPLDAHPELGNNAQLARRLGLVEQGRFGEQDLGCYGELAQPQLLRELTGRIGATLQRTPLLIGEEGRTVRRIAWCSGGAQDYFEQAIMLGVEAYLTGEISERHAHIAEETGVAFIAAGHHATERYGVQALGEHLVARFGIEHRFFDMEVPV